MPTTAERLGIVETKVHGLDEKIDELKIDVKDVHDDLTTQLKTMYDASCSQHSALAKEISALKSQRDKWVWLAAGGLAVFGWVSGHSDIITKVFG
jgi:hypothetical protein